MIAQLAPSAVEAYINSLPWTTYESDYDRTLVAGNIRSFVASLTSHDSNPWTRPPAATELWAYWMRSADFVGNAIAALTDGAWSHAGLMVYHPTTNSAEVYEAIFADGKIDKRDAKARFQSFLDADLHNRRLLVPLRREVFGYGDAEVQRVIDYADSCVRDVSYGRWQLLGMALAQRFGIPFPGSTTKQVCSELLARCLGAGDHEGDTPVICDLRDDRHDTYDLCTPDSTKRRLMDILAGYGDFTRKYAPLRSPAFT